MSLIPYISDQVDLFSSEEKGVLRRGYRGGAHPLYLGGVQGSPTIVFRVGTGGCPPLEGRKC